MNSKKEKNWEIQLGSLKKNVNSLNISEWMEMIAKKIVSDQNANVILFDYATLSTCNYIYLAKKVTRDLGEYLAKSIDRWQLDLDQTHMIAHSLGAHIGKGKKGRFLSKLIPT